ncbi:MAG: ASCH domain-containing protein [Patescibacteria group bacterium]
MKTLKFKNHLVKEILEGRKTVTWRLFDDKDLRTGDMLALIDSSTGEKFAEAQIAKVREKTLGYIEEPDFADHKKHQTLEDMLKHFKGYYGDKVAKDTLVKIIDFRVTRILK